MILFVNFVVEEKYCFGESIKCDGKYERATFIRFASKDYFNILQYE